MKSTTMKLVVVLVLLAAFACVAGAANKDRIGTAGAQELLLPVGARGLAIGGSYMTYAQGVDAIYYNPAGLASITNSVEALLSSMNYIADIGVVNGALGVKAGEFGVLGVSIRSLSFGQIPVTTIDFPDGNGAHYSPTYITLGATYAKTLTDRISVGFTTSVISEKILDVSASGVCFDFGIQYHNLAVQGLNLAVAVKNVGPSMTFSGSGLLVQAQAGSGLRPSTLYSVNSAAFELPSLMEIGVSYSRKFDEKNSLMVGGLFRNNNYLDDEYNLGAEYAFNDLFFVRGGYTFSPQADKDPTGTNSYIYDYTVGAGVHYPVGDVDLTFDYAFRHTKYFAGNNVIAIKLGF